MFKFLMIIFLIGFVLFSLLGFSVVRSFREFFFGSPKSRNRQYSASQGRQSGTRNSTQRPKTNRKKVISPNEGEYVDYEEIKD